MRRQARRHEACACLGAVEVFTAGLVKEVAEEGTHATAGEPGRLQRVAARIPMRRPGEAPEIAEAIVWLLSDKASYVTGSVLKVAGGL
jgi:NAD(P)-dependent dehydrogenase (short-subunit alcohol dehydrogenase family)